MLNGHPVAAINANLTSGNDLTRARRLASNIGIAFMGDTKGGPFDIPGDVARAMLSSPNPDGRSNADVVRPWVNGLDLTRRPRDMWIIDFGADMPIREAALYEAPFEYVVEHAKPQRESRREHTINEWWLHERATATACATRSRPVPLHCNSTRIQAPPIRLAGGATAC